MMTMVLSESLLLYPIGLYRMGSKVTWHLTNCSAQFNGC